MDRALSTASEEGGCREQSVDECLAQRRQRLGRSRTRLLGSRNSPAADVSDERDGQAGYALLARIIGGADRREAEAGPPLSRSSAGGLRLDIRMATEASRRGAG